MHKVVFLLLAMAVVASAIPGFNQCASTTPVAPNYSFDQWTTKCWNDNPNDQTTGAISANMCACFNKFPTWIECDLKAQFKYKAYLKNGCADAPTSTWIPPIAESSTNQNVGQLNDLTNVPSTGIAASPPCIAACAAKAANVNDLCTIAETCTDVSTCLWDEAYYLASLKKACTPACALTGDMANCITANSLSSASVCHVLETCQPWALPSSSCSASEKTVVDYRRAMCACPYGEVKSANGKRCDPIKRVATQVTVTQDFRSGDGGVAFFNANVELQKKIRVFIGQKIFATHDAKAAGLYEDDAENLLAMVKINSIEALASVTTDIEQDRRLEETRELVQGTAAPTYAGQNSGPGVRITYTVSMENKPIVSSLSTPNPENTIPQNIHQYISDVVSYAPLDATHSVVLTSFAESLTTMIIGVKGSNGTPHPDEGVKLCGNSFNALCLSTYAALSGVPSLGVVVTERTSGPTAAPTAAPTARDAYTSSPIVLFSIAGGVAVLLFAFTCFRHHNPSSPVKKTEMIQQPKAAPAAVKAPAASAPAAPAAVASTPAVFPPPAPAAEVVSKSPVKAARA